MPLSILPTGTYDEGQDVTEILGIKKYDPEAEAEQKLIETKLKNHNNRITKFLARYKWYRRIFMLTKKKGGFPSFIKRTDETRLQNMPQILKEHENTVFDVREKLDGCVSGRTLIHTDKGYFRISKIVTNKLDVKVLSYNETTGATEFKKILDYHKIPSNKPTYRIGISRKGKGGNAKFIECSDNHKFFTQRGWVRADELKITDKPYHYTKGIPYEIEQLILGCLLGDSSITCNSETGNYRSVTFNHGIKQLDYFNYKKQLLGNLFVQSKDAHGGFEGSGVIKRGILVSNLKILNIINKYCLKDGNKTVTEKWADELSPISLAFWYMDDGSICNRESENLSCRAMFHTQGFSYKEHIILTNALKRKFNIEAKIGDYRTYKGFVILLDVENTEKLCSIIAPYICKSMKYKLPKKYEELPCIYENKTFNTHDDIIETNILSIEQKEPHAFGKSLYDLTVEDNENYFANNVLVHNCSATFFLVKNKTRFLFGKKYIFGVCSRNIHLSKPDDSCYWKIAKKYDIERKLIALMEILDCNYIVLQGEIIGDKIQGNKYKILGHDFYAFNLIIDDEKIPSLSAERILRIINVKFVPSIESEFILKPTVDEMVEYAKGTSTLWNTPREGIVVRSYNNDISFKVINPDFLLKNDE